MAASSSASSQLSPFSHSSFHPPVGSTSSVATCPTLDLTAASGDDDAMYVRRRGGDVVSKLTERNKQVQAVAWKTDGQYVAVAWSDGVVRLVGLESSKAVHQIRLFEGDGLRGQKVAGVRFIAWVKNLAGCPESWQGNILGNLGDGGTDELLDLPRAVLFLDVEDDLPTLLPLPVSGGSGDDMFVFSTQTSLDFMFSSIKPSQGDAIHLMLLGTDDGSIHVCIYDTYVMGTFHVPLPPRPGAEPSKEIQEAQEAQEARLHLRRHASHPAICTHSLLLANEEHDPHAVYLAPMDFSFIFTTPLNLSLLEFKTTTFQKLQRYIKQTQIHMQGEWNASRELPARFLAGIQEDLAKDPRYKTIGHAFRIAVVGGYVPPTLKQWLVETIADRGHKRWDKAVTSGLENLRDLLNESFMPALERAVLALARLQGLAEFHSDEDIGFSETQLMRLVDMLSCLIQATHSALKLVTAELELFCMFSQWLRALIDRLAQPSHAEEQAEKEPQLSVAPVLDYISDHLLSSPLELHFGKVSAVDWEAEWKVIDHVLESSPSAAGKGPEVSETPLMDRLMGELDKFDRVETDNVRATTRRRGAANPRVRRSMNMGDDNDDNDDNDDEAEVEDGADETMDKGGEGQKKAEPHMKAFPTFEFLTKLFATHADRTLKEIAGSGRRHVHIGPLTRFDVGLPIRRMQAATKAIMKSDLEESPNGLTVTAITCKNQPRTLHLFQSAISTMDGISKSVSTKACTLSLAVGGSIADVQFLNADLALVLWTWTAKDRPPRLLALPTQSSKLTYGDYSQGKMPQTSVQLDPDAMDGLFWTADLNNDTTASLGRVARMEVLGPRDSSESSSMPARANLIYADGVTYRSFALPPTPEMMGKTESQTSS